MENNYSDGVSNITTQSTTQNLISERKETTRIILITFLVMGLWGALFPFVKLGYIEFQLDTSNPANLLLFAGIRFTISGLVISSFCLFRDNNIRSMNTKSYLGIFIVAVFAVVFHYACTYIGLANVDSSVTALLKQSGALIFVCFSFLFFKEDKFSIQKLFAALLSVLSILVVNMNALKFEFSIWTLLIIGASVCTVVSNVVCKKMLGNVSSLTTTGFSQFAGGIILLLTGILSGGRITTCTPRALLVFTYIIVTTVISYSLWYSVVKRYDLSKLFIIKMAEPLFAALVSLALPLGAEITWNHLIAFALVFGAVLVSNMKINKK